MFCTVHPGSVDAFFEEAEKLGMRMLAGKVLMDRNAPAALLDTAQSGYDDSKAALLRWHDRGRLLYCVTPRFAATSSPAQLDAASTLWHEHPDTYLQSHIAENRSEDRVGRGSSFRTVPAISMSTITMARSVRGRSTATAYG